MYDKIIEQLPATVRELRDVTDRSDSSIYRSLSRLIDQGLAIKEGPFYSLTKLGEETITRVKKAAVVVQNDNEGWILPNHTSLVDNIRDQELAPVGKEESVKIINSNLKTFLKVLIAIQVIQDNKEIIKLL